MVKYISIENFAPEDLRELAITISENITTGCLFFKLSIPLLFYTENAYQLNHKIQEFEPDKVRISMRNITNSLLKKLEEIDLNLENTIRSALSKEGITVEEYYSILNKFNNGTSLRLKIHPNNCNILETSKGNEPIYAINGKTTLTKFCFSIIGGYFQNGRKRVGNITSLEKIVIFDEDTDAWNDIIKQIPI